jgi:hypothetical protein
VRSNWGGCDQRHRDAHKAATTVTYALADPMIADLLRVAKRF